LVMIAEAFRRSSVRRLLGMEGEWFQIKGGWFQIMVIPNKRVFGEVGTY
jgi:hypothetical protein